MDTAAGAVYHTKGALSVQSLDLDKGQFSFPVPEGLGFRYYCIRDKGLGFKEIWAVSTQTAPYQCNFSV